MTHCDVAAMSKSGRHLAGYAAWKSAYSSVRNSCAQIRSV